MEKKTFAQEYESIGVFLILELLALACFGLGGSYEIFHYAGFIVSLAAVFFAFRNFSKDDLVPIAVVGVPLFLMAIFTSFGHYFEDASILQNLAAFFAIIGFFAIGLSARRIKSFSVKNALFCIAGGLALLTLIGTFATWIQYGFFYPVIHRGASNYYYNGNLYSIAHEMSWLFGFKIVEVSQNYGGLFAILCASFLPALLYIKYKENKTLFLVFAIVSGIGLVSLITIPNLYALLFLAIAYGVALYYRFLKNNETAMKIVHIGIPAVFGIAVVFLFVAILNLTVSGVNSAIAGSSILNRIFNANGIMNSFNPLMSLALSGDGFFGIHRYYFPSNILYSNTECFEIEIIREGGSLAFLLFIIFVVMAFEAFCNYLKRSKDNDYVKVIFLTMVVAYILYMTMRCDVWPITHSEKNQNYFPVTRSLPFLLMLFIIGYIILPKNKDEIEFKEVVVENSEKSEVKKSDDDYDFSDVEEEEIV